MTKILMFSVFMAVMVFAGIATAQDPGVQDSMIVGNFDRSNITVGLAETVRVQIWVKTDDSVSFIHIPLATDNRYVTSRNGGGFLTPFSLWDDVSFLPVDTASPQSGWTSQSILGFAYLVDPMDPQNFLNTNLVWTHIADFKFFTTSDPGANGVRMALRQGRNRANGNNLFGLSDGMTEIVPATYYDSLIFPTTGVDDGIVQLPRETALLGTYPNPFNSSTTIRYSLAERADVIISIYNVTGQLVNTFRMDNQSPGEGSVTWTGNDQSGGTVSSGVYFYRMEAGPFKATSRAILLK